jgi:hypothetical protein
MVGQLFPCNELDALVMKVLGGACWMTRSEGLGCWSW